MMAPSERDDDIYFRRLPFDADDAAVLPPMPPPAAD